MGWPILDLQAGFPLLPERVAPGAWAAWARAHRAPLQAALTRAGAVLLQETGLERAEEFQAFWAAFDEQPRRYVEGQSQRERVAERVYTSTAYPAAEVVTLHHELSYVRNPPRYLAFFCEIAPDSGGATPIADGRQVLRALSDGARAAFAGRGIRYLKTMHGGQGGALRFGKSWQEHFETDDRAAVEAHLREGGAKFTWLDDGGLRTEQVRPAVWPHPISGEPVWFNQASLWHVSNLGARGRQLLSLLGEERLPTHATFEDGSQISDVLMDEVRRVTRGIAVAPPWRRGDIMLLDNRIMLHGRDPFAGQRRVLVAMGDGPRP